jgi:hypothetical protein
VFLDVLPRFPDRDRGCVRLGRPGEVERCLREVQLCLRQADVLDRVGGGDGHQQGPRVGVAHVLGGEDHHPPRDEARILARLEHHREVVDGSVGVAAAHRLDEGGRVIVVLVARTVVPQRTRAGGVGDVALVQRGAFRLGGLPGELERLQCCAAVPAGPAGDVFDELLGHVGLEHLRPAPHHRRRLFVGKGLELVDRAAGKQRRVDLEVRVLRRGSDQRDEAVFDGMQDRVLLRLVEAVDLVDEEDRPSTVSAEALLGPLED